MTGTATERDARGGGPESVRARHRSRKAVVYVRQSTEEQVLQNTGSTTYQRNQARFPREWGWPSDSIEVMDQDLGLSGIATEHRPAYQRMLEDIQQNRVGAIFMADLTRAGRNALEWFRLLELCRNYDVLLVVDGKVYDTNDSGELLLTRLLATLGEHENMMRRDNMNRGRIAKAAAGHTVTNPPAGYVRQPDASWAKDPDPAVRETVATVFREFLRERSCKRTVIKLQALGVRLPRRSRAGVRWAEPQVGTIYSMLRNPSYKGEYHYRRQSGDPRAGRDARGALRLRPSPQDTIVSPIKHEPYLSGEVWDQVQAILKLNGRRTKQQSLGPGSALLQGVIRCEIHRGRAMTSVYKKKRQDGGRSHAYHCMGDYWTGEKQCGWIAGETLDDAAVRAIIDRLQPPALATIRESFRRARGDADSESNRQQLDVDRARRHADDLKRRYLVVDIENRLVAKELESQLENAQRALEQAERTLDKAPFAFTVFADEGFAQLRELCANLPALWAAETTTHFDRKQIIRTMVTEIALIRRDRHSVKAKITWADGSPPTFVQAPRTRNERTRQLIIQMDKDGHDPDAITKVLNERDILTHHGRPWNPLCVKQKLLRMKGENRDGAL